MRSPSVQVARREGGDGKWVVQTLSNVGGTSIYSRIE